MLSSRLITAFILILMVIVTLFWLPLSWFVVTTLIVCMLAAWEWGKLIGFTLQIHLIWFTLLCGLLLIIIFLTITSYNNAIQMLQLSSLLSVAIGWWIIALFMVIYYPSSAGLWRQSRVLRLLFGVLIIVPFFFSMLALRYYHYNIDHFIGSWWLLYVMVLVWSADSGAYIFGNLFGKHELASKISPGKTWEGFFGGIVTSMLISWLFNWWASLTIAPSIFFSSSIIAILASVLGDLTESMFKREAGIKDSGYILPGHGGILDRIDSLTAAVPVFAYLMLLVFRAL